jgi:hypothetical protein
MIPECLCFAQNWNQKIPSSLVTVSWKTCLLWIEFESSTVEGIVSTEAIASGNSSKHELEKKEKELQSFLQELPCEEEHGLLVL